MKYKRDKLGRFLKGNNSIKYWLGRKRGKTSIKTKVKISLANKGKKRSLESINNYKFSKTGEKNPRYIKGKFITKSGHILILKHNHPNKNCNNYVYEHKIIMENYLGRLLYENEVIHHIDGDPGNNKIENLFLTTKSGNSKAHHSINKLLKYFLDKKIVIFNSNLGIYEINKKR